MDLKEINVILIHPRCPEPPGSVHLETLTDIVGFHIHLVKFDAMVSDGSANGWNKKWYDKY